MAEQPALVDRDEVPYVSLPAVVTMEELAGAIDMGRALEIELGVPVPSGTTGDETVAVDVLPSGRYASLVHVTNPAEEPDPSRWQVDIAHLTVG